MILPLLILLAVEPKSPAPQLLTVKRVFVDRLAGGAPAETIRDLIITSLQNSNQFQITENEDRADAFIRGSADLQVYTELHDTNESISGRISLRHSKGPTNSRDINGNGLSISEHDSARIQERHQEAIATVRLVLKNGDVIWSTTQESIGAKFRGASADVADKVTRQLMADLERVRFRSPADVK